MTYTYERSQNFLVLEIKGCVWGLGCMCACVCACMRKLCELSNLNFSKNWSNSYLMYIT